MGYENTDFYKWLEREISQAEKDRDSLQTYQAQSYYNSRIIALRQAKNEFMNYYFTNELKEMLWKTESTSGK